jgi:hypothetical protein
MLERPDGLIVAGDALAVAHIANIVGFAAKNRLPAMYDVSAFVLVEIRSPSDARARLATSPGYLRAITAPVAFSPFTWVPRRFSSL